jgi:hypothetical protein
LNFSEIKFNIFDKEINAEPPKGGILYFIICQHQKKNIFHRFSLLVFHLKPNFSTSMIKTSTFLKSVCLILVGIIMGYQADAQVTTSALTGIIKDDKGEGLPGATVLAVHTPTGTRYGTVTDPDGRFSFPNVRVGGPYTVNASFIGYQDRGVEGIVATLGTPTSVTITLAEDGKLLDEIIVKGGKNSFYNNEKTGAGTSFNNETINALPTVSRRVTDFTRLTPQANGNSFAGRDGRYNNFQVDGANFNNGFGLNDNPLPGGGGLSIDAIEEIQVNLAPYDVKQGGFTGAGINAVTRSGTNKFVGSVYHFFKNESLIGRKVMGDELSNIQSGSTKTYGFRLGGPIIENKLFFFVNAEQIKSQGPNAGAVNLWKASANGVANAAQNITRVSVSDLEAVSNHLRNQWGYDPGAYQNYANGESQVNLFLARIDWNISDKHKLAIRYNRTVNDVPSLPSPTSGASPRGSNTYSRVSENAMSFGNSMYFTSNNIESYTAELNSSLSPKLSNQFLATYSKILTGRTSPSAEFPFIDIGTSRDNLGPGSNEWRNYISAGYELFTYNNKVENDNYTIINNLNYRTGKHDITLGASFEMQKFANNYLRNGTSYYRYRTVEDFLTTGTPNEVAPIMFALTYPYAGADPMSRVNYALPALYIQDKINVNSKLELTAGLRAEIPMFTNSLTANNSVDNLTLLSPDGSETRYRSGEWPKTRMMLSPRVGFRYDAMGDKSLIVRGGTGIFAGRVPFVWLTNMPSNTGVIQNQIEPGDYGQVAAWINDIRFQPEKHYWINNTPESAKDVFIQSPKDGIPGSLALVNPNFRMPQIFRTSIGVDKKLTGTPVTFTLDAMYTKDIQSIYQFGSNIKSATKTMVDGRDFYENSTELLYNSTLGANSGQILTNTRLGQSLNVTAGFNVAPWNGLSGSLFYSHTMAQTVSDNTGSNAASAWGATPNRGNINDIFLSSSADALPHRVVGSVSYKRGGTLLTLFYNGSHQGRYSFTYNGDMNGDGIGNDLLYIPNDASEINFVANGNFSVADQVKAFNELMNNSDYLRNNKGKMAERNGALMPWYQKVDLRLVQDIFPHKIGKNGSSLQLTFDIENFGNMLNTNWGVLKSRINNSNTPLSVVTRGNNPTFRMNTASIDGKTVLPTEMYQDLRTPSSTWSAQVGIRYNFN